MLYALYYSPGRESKLGSIIDQLRVNREKVTKERKNNAADGNHVRHDILADLTRDRPAPGFTNDNREDAIASITERRDDVSDLTKKRADGVADLSKERRYISTDAKVPKSIWQIPSQVSNSPLAKGKHNTILLYVDSSVRPFYSIILMRNWLCQGRQD